MTREETLTKIIDELIVLFCLPNGKMDFNIIDRALSEIAATRQSNCQHPMTLALYNYMTEKGYLQHEPDEAGRDHSS